MQHFFPNLLVELVTAGNGKPFKLASGPKRRDHGYEDHAYVWAGLRAQVDSIRQRFATDNPRADYEICIDLTAGTKTFSMAAANVRALVNAVRLCAVVSCMFLAISCANELCRETVSLMDSVTF